MRTRAWVMGALWLAGCGVDGDPDPAPEPAPVVTSADPDESDHALRDDARLVMERACGECHIGTYDSAVPAALDVYDLTEAEWAARLDAAQMRDVLFRLSEPTIPVRNEPDGAPNPTTDEDRRRVEAYLRAEAARRDLDWEAGT